MDIFRTPGAGLTPGLSDSFDQIKSIVNLCTNDILNRPDWVANLQIVDAVNGINSDVLRNEVVFLLRRKLSSSKARTVFLTITLVEAIVKNGGERVHAAVGTEPFMKDLAKVARKYNNKSGSENMEVKELALDVIQAWGEAFLSKQKQFPAFVKTYHDLRKEGLQFKTQYDANRVPIFSPVGIEAGDCEDRGILEAAMAASRSDHPESRSTSKPTQLASSTAAPKRASSTSEEVLESMVTSLGIFAEVLSASTSASALRENDMAAEVAMQLRSLQDAMATVIEYELNHDGEDTELLFKVNDDSQMLLAVYDGIMDGTCNLAQAMEIVSIVAGPVQDVASPASKPSTDFGPNLLDFLDSSDPSDSFNTGTSMWDTTPMPLPPLVVATKPSAFLNLKPVPVPAPALVSNIGSPSTYLDPFANDPDPFGPGTSSIDDLLASPPTAPAPSRDPFSRAFEAQILPAQPRQVPVFDPFGDVISPGIQAPAPAPITMSAASHTATTGSMSEGFDAFQGLGVISQQKQAYQQPYPVQQQPSPMAYKHQVFGASSSATSAPGPSPYPNDQPQPSPYYQQQQQQMYHQQQQMYAHQQGQQMYAQHPPHEFNTSSSPPYPDPFLASAAAQHAGSPFQAGVFMNMAAPPVPTSLPPTTMQYQQQQQQHQHNPFDAF